MNEIFHFPTTAHHASWHVHYFMFAKYCLQNWHYFFIAYFKNCNFNIFCPRNVIGPSPVKPQREEIPKARSLEEKYYKFL